MAEQQHTNLSLLNETDLAIPLSQDLAAKSVEVVSELEDCVFFFIEVVYVDETEIRQINKKHLNHDYVTDIITFNYNEPDDADAVEATLFCCAPRIEEQAGEFGSDIPAEFLRVFIHGLLHLAGYNDQTTEQKTIMREKES
ncbi:MAG: rRNA maturation RNase YbeY, partial [Balneolales bacterium]